MKTSTQTLTFDVAGTGGTIELTDFHTVVAGYTGRDAAAVQHHIDELAAIGVAPPPAVPMFYPVEGGTVSSAAELAVDGAQTSGEIEPLYIRHGGRYYLGIASDHTDRHVETFDIGDSKRACPKPVAETVIPVPELHELSLDECRARSWVDGRLYQDGTLDGLRTPANVVELLLERTAIEDGDFEDSERDFSGNIRRFFERILAENLYVSYAIIPPQVSRATTASGWEGDFLQVGVVKETEEGLIVRGSQMLATGGAIADEVFVTCIKPLGPDDVDFAISFALPSATEGLKFLCRRPFAPAATSEFDYPLTSHYDEPDALVIFDDVLVPWDRVFIDRNVDTLRRQFFETGAHALGNWQAQTRFTTKLQFIAAVARKITQVNGTDKIPGVQEKLGELAALVSSVESALIAAEYTAEADSSGMLVPGKRALYGVMGLQSETYPRVIGILRDLVGGGVLQLPSSVMDMKSPVTAPDVERYIASPGVPSEERIKLFRLAWDIIGSEFAGRHQQYELFYAGAPFVVKGVYTYRNYGYEAQVAELDEFLAGYGVDGRKEDN